MIQSKQDLKTYLRADNSWYEPLNTKSRFIAAFAHYPQRSLKRYLYFLRKQEYYINTAKGSKIKGLLGLIYEGKKNKLGEKLGIDIPPNCFGKGLQIYHAGIIVNSNVRAGENCVLHGGNCIGNNGITDANPTLGNNVDIGYGAVLIGDIRIADDCVIGANAVVNHSIPVSGSVVVGVPGKIIKTKNQQPEGTK